MEFLRKYWFICLLCIAFLGVLIFYISDMNKDNVAGKSADGVDVIASLNLENAKTDDEKVDESEADKELSGDITSEQLFNAYQTYNQSLLYNMYRNAVVDQSIETTDAIKQAAKTLSKTVETNMDSDNSGKTRYQIIAELASNGYVGEDKLYDYCVTLFKNRELNYQYVDNNFDKYKDSVTASPRTISLISMAVTNPDALSEEENKKKTSIDQALERGDDFGDTATAFSEHTGTAANKGFFGYMDGNSTALPSEIISAAKELKAGDVSDWISVQDQNTGLYTIYKVKVEETDVDKLFHSDNDNVKFSFLEAIMNANPGLEVKVVQEHAKDLEITFDNDDVKEKIESYIEMQTGGSGNE